MFGAADKTLPGTLASHFRVPGFKSPLSPIQVSANVHRGRMQVIAQVLGSPTTHVESSNGIPGS